MQFIWSWFRDEIVNHSAQAETIGMNIVGVVIEIVILYIVARITIRLTTRFTHRFLQMRAVKLDERRRNTLRSLSENAIRYTIYTIYVLMILPRIGFHIEALLAGAGIAGVAIGFGAQNLIKDILTGFFILFEDQYAVGDTVTINDFTGTVRTIGLRLTRIQAGTGEIEIIPNGQIANVTNYSKTDSLAIIDISIHRENDLTSVLAIMANELETIKTETKEIIGDVQVLGIQELHDSSIVLRATAECKSMAHYGVKRIVLQGLTEAFVKQGIKMPEFHTVLLKQEP